MPNVTDPTALGLVVQALADLRDDMRNGFSELNEKVDRVEAHTTATNGRVGRLELWQARSDGAKAAYRWVLPVFTSLFCGCGGTLIVLAITGH